MKPTHEFPCRYRLIFADNIRKLRQITGQSQEHLAHRVGISRTYLGEIERGKRNIGIDLMEKIAAELNIPLELLLQKQTKPTCPPPVGCWYS